jgi:hypothetical protein
MTLLAHIHRFQTTALIRDDNGAWRERQACEKCPWAVRHVKLDATPEDEPPPHKAPCWCPRCMNRKRRR